MKRVRPLICAGLTAALFGSTATLHADEAQPDYVMYGFDREAGQLLRHELGQTTSQLIGPVKTSDGKTLKGIDGAAYAPTFQNIFAFWTDPDAHRGRFAYVDVHTGEATLAEQYVEGGRVTGAVAVPEDEGKWAVYAVQLAEIMPPQTIEGTVRLNPNNSNHMQFDLVEINSSGSVVRHWTRDDLLNARNSNVDGSGTLIQGYASYFRIRPIGQGGQRDIQLGDETITLQNSNTYVFTSSENSPMQIRVYNAQGTGQGNGNLPMGHWYLTIEGGTAYQGEEAQVLTPRRLVRVTHKDEVEVNDVTGEEHEKPAGTVNELFTVSHDYDSLASIDGQTFYATTGNKIYQINRDTGSETLVGTMSAQDVFGLEFAGNSLIGFEILNDRLGQINFETGQTIGTMMPIGMQNLGAIVFCPYEKDPNAKRAASFVGYD